MMRPMKPLFAMPAVARYLFLVCTVLTLQACTLAPGDGRGRLPGGGDALETQRGKCAVYADSFEGRPTASGEIYAPSKLTAAHKSLPFGSVCRVINDANGKSVEVRINDRGPYVQSRIMDISYRAASLLGALDSKNFSITLEVLEYGPSSR